MASQQRCSALLVLLTICHVSQPIHANIYNRMQSSASTFNPLSRMRIRGGETAAATVPNSTTSNAASAKTASRPIPKVPTSSTVRRSTVSTTPKKRRRKKRVTGTPPAIPPPAQVPKKVVPKSAPVKPKATVTTPAPAPKPVLPTPAEPVVPLNISKITEKTQSKVEEESQHDKMPSIFTKDEEKQYDVYSACLAATESLRRIRDAKVKKQKGTAVAQEDKSWKSMLKSTTSGSGSSTNGPVGEEEYKRACAEYVLNSSKAINALGLSVTQFNQLGREVSKNKSLKEKVMEQAYLYRMASTIKMDKIPLIQDPDSKQLLKSTRRRRVQMFVRSIDEIEELRAEQTERLKKALKLDKLPSNVNLCDPNVMPLLSPQVKAVIEAFPLQAEEIVKKYGLNSDEFNQMLEETRGNPVFRWRVQRFRKNHGGEDMNRDF